MCSVEDDIQRIREAKLHELVRVNNMDAWKIVDNLKVVVDCPKCDYTIFEGDSYEEATVGGLGNGLPHITCPRCKECIGCMRNEESTRSGVGGDL